ncbi:hypothetical protein M404DRAFT_27519 [Pisolithus tinctorius Marx 270]|uniref:Uncharacterized protein n=1 Tax=Pisolithus tinctorius Marx 270 TaxID=870435 RepID=A0A0C3P6C8_PISTI|nr:hypothetical protein M404DRAFT_27519 [Pisolithus tinctorius Marx 270]
MSKLTLITMTDNNDEGQVIEEVMKAKSKERKRQKRAEREKAEAERAVWEAEEKRAHKEEERWEAECKCKAKARKGSEAGGEVKKVVMHPSCTCCAQAKVICEFLMDGNKKWVACVCCNQLKGKCQWPRDGKDAEAGPKAIGKVNKGKKWKVDEENAEAGSSNQKQVRMSMRPIEVLDLNEPKAGRSRVKEASMARYLGSEDKLKQLIEAAGLIANNLASLFELHETTVKNSGHIADALELLLDESYSFGMVVSPSDLGSSELDSDELHEEADWLKNHSKDKEEEAEGEDEGMAE